MVGHFELIQCQIPDISHLNPYGGGGGVTLVGALHNVGMVQTLLLQVVAFYLKTFSYEMGGYSDRVRVWLPTLNPNWPLALATIITALTAQ